MTLMKQKDIDLILELSKKEISVKEQILLFKKISGKSNKTFFRYRKNLHINAKTKDFNYCLRETEKCYFCLKDSQIIHHINQNNKDNRNCNLIPLCKSCHNKIHRVLNVIVP